VYSFNPGAQTAEKKKHTKKFRKRGSIVDFYRATLCVSAVFAVARCPSVRLSVTLVHCIQTVEDIVKLLFRPGNPITLVFLPARRSKRGICYGNVFGWLAGWVAVRHTPVLYQNG